MQLDLFGATQATAIQKAAPPVVSSLGTWSSPDSLAFNAALSRGSLRDAISILNQLKSEVVGQVLLASGFEVRAGLLAPRAQMIAGVQSDLVAAAMLSMTGRELREHRAKASQVEEDVGIGDFEGGVSGLEVSAEGLDTLSALAASAEQDLLAGRENRADMLQVAAPADTAVAKQQPEVDSEILPEPLVSAVTASSEVQNPFAQVTEPVPVPGRVIEDAGAELTYNRRNRSKSAKSWDDIGQLNDALKVKETVKANIWPKPDYEALIDGGMQPIIAHIYKQVYDGVAPKPVATRDGFNDNLIKTYISSLNKIEDGLNKWVNNPAALSQWAASNARVAGAMLGHKIGITDLLPVDNLLLTVFPGGWRAWEAEVRAAGANKLLSALQPGYSEIERAIKSIGKGWPSKREAWQIQGFSVVARNDVSVEQSTFGDKPFIVIANKKLVKIVNALAEGRTDEQAQVEAQRVADAIGPFLLLGKRGFLDSFESEELAIEAAKGLAKREKAGGSIDEIAASVADVEREGVNRRLDGEDISAERLMNEFGLKGVNFGNWMKTPAARAEAQLHLNHAFDSFHDLADVLGVPPKTISLGGMLGLAIGAQGSGGRNAAHFVAGVNEINLTRTAGAGALAHEWAHALDHYFAVQAGLATSTEPFLTEHAGLGSTRTTYEKIDGGYKTQDVPRFGELRPEINDAFKSIIEAMDKRLETEDEFNAANANSLALSNKRVSGWLNSIRRDFTGLEAEFDVLADKVRSGDVGEGRIALGSSASISPVVAEIRDLYKSKHGRVYSIDQLKGLQSNVDGAKFRSARAQAQAEHVPAKVASDFAKSAYELDTKKGGKPYWSTKLEKFARAFDAFISDELEAKQAKNGYLSRPGQTGATVPMGEERIAINNAFRGLVGAVRVKDVEQGPVLFSKGPVKKAHVSPAVVSTGSNLESDPQKPDIQFSVDTNGFAGLSLQEVNAEIRTLRTRWPGMPPVHVVKSGGDLPFEAPSNADGAYLAGQVYVVTDNIQDLKQLQKVMAHECVMHHALEEMLGNYGFAKLHHGLQKLKAAGDPTVCSLAANIKSRYGDLSPEIETKEMVARAGELCLDEKGDVKVEFGFMKSVFAGITGWLRDHGIKVPFTNTELQGIMHSAGEWIKVGPELSREGLQQQGVAVPVHSFAGQGAATANLEALMAAQAGVAGGQRVEAVRRETGWEQGVDSKWRFEIDDSGAKLKPPFPKNDMRWGDVLDLAEAARHKDGVFGLPLKDVLDHPALFDAYPHLADISVQDQDGKNASFVRSPGEPDVIRIGRDAPMHQVVNFMLHEIQHGIQNFEGFALGGQPRDFKDVTHDEVADMLQADLKKARSAKAIASWHKVSWDSFSTDTNPVPTTAQQKALDRVEAARIAAREFENTFKHPKLMSAFDQYMNLAGEVEARNTQKRHGFTASERKEFSPEFTADVKRESVILSVPGTDRVPRPVPAVPLSVARPSVVVAPSPQGVIEPAGQLVMFSMANREHLDARSAQFPLATDIVSGLVVRDDVPNMSSISSSLDDYEILNGVREISLDAFKLTGKSYSVSECKRIEDLASAIKLSGEINPLIVVVDKDGPYILEGGHRAEALFLLGVKSLPAIVVEDMEVEMDVPSNRVVEGSFSGQILDVVDGYAVQKINRAGDTVSHDVAFLTAAVKVSDTVDIKYQGGFGVVGGLDKGKDRGR